MKETIERLNMKMDGMREHTERLQTVIGEKEREIQKIRSIYSMRGYREQANPVTVAGKKSKKDRSVQTVINLVDNASEYETFSYLYDKDQDLLRSEKDSLLKYMRREVV